MASCGSSDAASSAELRQVSQSRRASRSDRNGAAVAAAGFADAGQHIDLTLILALYYSTHGPDFIFMRAPWSTVRVCVAVGSVGKRFAVIARRSEMAPRATS
jgi:hypothetical protein